jgi:hypothetical protein
VRRCSRWPGRRPDPAHAPQMAVMTYTLVIRELKGEPRTSAEKQIKRARRKPGGPQLDPRPMCESTSWDGASHPLGGRSRKRFGGPFRGFPNVRRGRRAHAVGVAGMRLTIDLDVEQQGGSPRGRVGRVCRCPGLSFATREPIAPCPLTPRRRLRGARGRLRRGPCFVPWTPSLRAGAARRRRSQAARADPQSPGHVSETSAKCQRAVICCRHIPWNLNVPLATQPPPRSARDARDQPGGEGDAAGTLRLALARPWSCDFFIHLCGLSHMGYGRVRSVRPSLDRLGESANKEGSVAFASPAPAL